MARLAFAFCLLGPLVTALFLLGGVKLGARDLNFCELIVDTYYSSPSSSSASVERHVIGPIGAAEPSPTTVVAIYFALDKSKHAASTYATWITSFLQSVSHTPLVMFVDRASFATFKRLRSANNTMRTTFVVYEDVWQAMRELEAKRGRRDYAHLYRTEMLKLDTESFHHKPEMYAIWNLKSYLTHKAARMNPYGSEFFVYNDAGAWRSGPIDNWPDPVFTKLVREAVGDRLLLGQVRPKNRADPGRQDSIEGGFFAGSANALADFQRVFYDMHDTLLDAGQFIGSLLFFSHIEFNSPKKNI